MKHALRDLAVLFFSYFGLAFLYRARAPHPLVRVIALHDVTDAVWFEDIVASLVRDFHVLTPGEYEKKIFHPTKINLLITFDDGYASWVSVCAPVFKKYGLRAIFFVNSGLLRAGEFEAETFVSERLKVKGRRTLSFDGARLLVQEGHTVGGHTTSHQSLRGAPRDVFQKEVGDDKALIEETLGVTLRHFAYPFGTHRDYSKETDELVHSSGYSFVYTAEPGFDSGKGTHIPRTLIETNQGYPRLYLWVMGGYDVFSNLKRFALRYTS